MYIVISQRTCTVKFFQEKNDLWPYFRKQYQYGDRVLEKQYISEVEPENYKLVNRRDINSAEAKALIRRIDLETDLSEVNNWDVLFEMYDPRYSKRQFVSMNIAYPLIGAGLICVLQPLVKIVLGDELTYGLGIGVLPLLMLFVRAGIGSYKLPKRMEFTNIRSRLYAFLHQLSFVLGLLFLFSFELSSGLVFADAELLANGMPAVAVALFFLYMLFISLSEFLYKRHRLAQLRTVSY